MRHIECLAAIPGLAVAFMTLPIAHALAQDAPTGERSRPDESHDSLLIQHQQQMTDRFYQTIGREFTRTLTDSGLSPADSEEITRRFAADFIQCTTSAVVVEAERQGISVDELLARLLQVTYVGNVDPPIETVDDAVQNVSKVMDVFSMEANLVPCVMTAMQSAGVSFQAGLDALPEPGGAERP